MEYNLHRYPIYQVQKVNNLDRQMTEQLLFDRRLRLGRRVA